VGERSLEIRRPEAAGDPGVTTKVVMLLDNHHAPDRRVEFEAQLLRKAGIEVRIVAWDRRDLVAYAEPAPPGVVRISMPAPPGGGRRSLAAMLRFAGRVWKRRRELFGGAQLLVVHDIYLLPLGRLLSASCSVPFVYDAHEEYARMEATRYPSWFLRAATKLETALARRADIIVVPGVTRVARWRAAGFEQILVLRNTGSRGEARAADGNPSWHLLHAGTLSAPRRLDLLLELARRRPDIRIAIAGAGKLAGELERTASTMPNVAFLGWLSDLSDTIARSRALYYGLDPKHPDAPTACPNTLYQALLHRRPLVYFGGGEISEVARSFRIGVRATPSPEGIAAALEEIGRTSTWDFDAAWEAVAGPEEGHSYVAAIAAAAAAAR
jgi:glycosyltransferase involved in cell wall biosynthesis